LSVRGLRHLRFVTMRADNESSLPVPQTPPAFHPRASWPGPTAKSAFIWLFLSYVLQNIGELLIMPIGYAMIGELVPRRYQA
jgi:MFS family permease